MKKDFLCLSFLGGTASNDILGMVDARIDDSSEELFELLLQLELNFLAVLDFLERELEFPIDGWLIESFLNLDLADTSLPCLEK